MKLTDKDKGLLENIMIKMKENGVSPQEFNDEFLHQLTRYVHALVLVLIDNKNLDEDKLDKKIDELCMWEKEILDIQSKMANGV